jgi:2-methylcitrate dehydratase PrpD
VEAALAIRRELKGAPKDVLSIEIEGTPTAHKALLDRLPGTVDEARFSAEFGVACALIDGAVRFSNFDERQLRRQDVVKLMSMSRTSETIALGPRRAARVTLEMKNGGRVRQTVADLPGVFGEAEFMQRLSDKVADCLAQAGIEEHTAALWEEALDPVAGSPESWPVFQRIWQQLPVQKEKETV